MSDPYAWADPALDNTKVDPYAWADPSSAPPASQPVLPKNNQDKVLSLALIKQFSTDPEVDAKIDMTRFFTTTYPMPFDAPFIFQNANAIQKAWTGSQYNQSIKGFTDKLSGTWKAMNLSAEIAKYGSQKLYGTAAPDVEDKIKALKAEMPPEEQQFQGLPRMAMDTFFSLGYQAANVAPMVSNYILGTLSGELLAKTLGFDTTLNTLSVANEARDRISGQVFGAAYQGALDQGINPKIAAAEAFTLGSINTLMWGLPAGKIVEKVAGLSKVGEGLVHDAVIESMAKAGFKGTVGGEIAKKLTFDFIKKDVPEQTLFAAMNSAAGTFIPELAVSLSNRVDGTNLTQKNIGELFRDWGIATAEQGLIMGGMAGLGTLVRGGKLYGLLKNESKRIAESPVPGEAPKTEVKSTKAKPDAQKPVEVPPVEEPPMTVEQALSPETPVPGKVVPIAEKPLFSEPVNPAKEAPTQTVLEKITPETPKALQYEARQVNPKDIVYDPTYAPNFKEGANAKGVIEELPGTFDQTGVAPVLLVERTDGTLVRVTGSHRIDLAQRSGTPLIDAHIFKESNGFTPEMAVHQDAINNIKAGNGGIKDYANYYRNADISREEASGSGLLGREAGRQGYSIGHDASEPLYDLYRNNRISAEKAAAIAEAAPRNETVQALGIKKSHDMTAEELYNYEKIVQQWAPAGENAVQTDLFGRDESAFVEAEKVARTANDVLNKKRDELSTLKKVSSLSEGKRAEVAAQFGVKVDDPVAVKARISELEADISAWSNWTQDPEKMAEIRQIAGLSQRSAFDRSSAPVAPETTVQPAQVPQTENLFGTEPTIPTAPSGTVPPEKPPVVPPSEGPTPQPAPQGIPGKKTGELYPKTETQQYVSRQHIKTMLKRMEDVNTHEIKNPDLRGKIETVVSGFTSEDPLTKIEGTSGIIDIIDANANAPFSVDHIRELQSLEGRTRNSLTEPELNLLHDALLYSAKKAKAQKIIWADGVTKDWAETEKQIIKEIYEQHKMKPAEGEGYVSTEKTLAGKIKKAKATGSDFLALSEQGKSLVQKVMGKGTAHDILVKDWYEMNRNDDLYQEQISAVIKDWKEKEMGKDSFLWERKIIQLPDRKVDMARGEQIKMYTTAKQKYGMKGMKEGIRFSDSDMPNTTIKFTEEEIKTIISSLDKTEISYAENHFSMGEKAGQIQEKVAEDINGFPVTWLKNYDSLLHIRSDVTIDDVIRQEQEQSMMNVGPQKGHLKERVASDKGIIIRNIARDQLEIIRRSAKYAATAKYFENANLILGSKKIQDAIINAHGSDVPLQYLIKEMRDKAGITQVQSLVEKGVTSLQNVGIHKALSGNPVSAFINRILIGNSWIYTDASTFLQSTAYVLVHPKIVHDFLQKRSVIYRTIGETGGRPEIEAALSAINEASRFSRIMHKIKEIGMVGQRWGNQGAAKNDIYNGYLYAMKNFEEGKQSYYVKESTRLTDKQVAALSVEDKENYAIGYGEWVELNIHANPDVSTKINLTREGVFPKAVAALGSDAFASLNTIIRLSRDIKSPGGKARLTKAVAVIFVTNTAIAFGIRSGYRWLANKPAQNPVEEIIQSNAGVVPVAGDVAYTTINAIHGGQPPSSTTLAGDYAATIYDLIRSSARYIKGNNKVKTAASVQIWRDVAFLVSGPLPTKQFENYWNIAIHMFNLAVGKQ